MLDNRLEICSEMVSGKGIVCDVGTDHAYLAVELIKTGKCEKVIASDIKDGPLDAARKNIEKYGVSDRVSLVKSNGVEDVELDGVTDIVIAGMGGETIADILRSADKIKVGTNMILQPMSKISYLRKWLGRHDYKIMEEKVANDGGKLYIIMRAEKISGLPWMITGFEAREGFFENDEFGAMYREKESARLAKKGKALEHAGMIDEAVHYCAMSERMLRGTEEVDINEIYSFLNSKYPFSLQESWDNSGMLVDNYDMTCSKVLLTLDIDSAAAAEAGCKGAKLIISHHPVIFEPLKKLDFNSPVCILSRLGIAAICMHTNLDIAHGGTNGVIVKKLSDVLDISANMRSLEELGDGRSLGWIIELIDGIKVNKLAYYLKKIFGCAFLRVNRNCGSFISRIAVCSGSGGSLMKLAIEKGCDAMITGDVKHDVWIDANNKNFTLFDCGHFHTENLVLGELRRALEEKFPLLDVEIAESSVDPCIYY